MKKGVKTSDPPGMKLKNTIQLFLAILIIASAVFALQAYSSNYCACPKKERTNKMIWENLSQQFFSSF